MLWVQTCTYNKDNEQTSQANYLNFFHVYNLPENNTRNSNFGIKNKVKNTEFT